MARSISLVETAKLLRKALKAAFPGVKFSVRTERFSGGTAINVGYTDGPSIKAVERVTSRFKGGTFDPMLDVSGYRVSDLDGEEVTFGATFVSVGREFTAAALRQVAATVCHDPDDYRIAEDSNSAWICSSDLELQTRIMATAMTADLTLLQQNSRQ